MLWLVGLMGSGKSTIGPLAADRLEVGFVDTDTLVEESTGRSVPELFDADPLVFRAAESDVVTMVASGDPSVVATGGGAVLSGTNRTRMRDSGTVVWLRADPATLAARVEGPAGRPLLEGHDPATRLAALAEERRVAYESVADVVIDTEEMTVEEVVEEVVAAWPGS